MHSWGDLRAAEAGGPQWPGGASVSDCYVDGCLPRAAPGADWYESELGTGDLLHGLARIALLERDGKDTVDPSYGNY